MPISEKRYGRWGSVTVDELLARYWSETRELIGYGPEEATKVVKIADDTIIKGSIYVSTAGDDDITRDLPMDNCIARSTGAEAINQRVARQLLDPSVVRIPEVYRSFLHQGYAYIVMEYIKGRAPEAQDTPELIPKLARLLRHMADISAYAPGPLGGGISHGILWEFEDIRFENLEDMENYWNTRIIPQKDDTARVSLGSFKLVLCHLDISPRNILLLDDGSFCLLDWESAGFYPRFSNSVRSGSYGPGMATSLNSFSTLWSL